MSRTEVQTIPGHQDWRNDWSTLPTIKARGYDPTQSKSNSGSFPPLIPRNVQWDAPPSAAVKKTEPYEFEKWRGSSPTRRFEHKFVTDFLNERYDTSKFPEVSRWIAELIEEEEYTQKGRKIEHWHAGLRRLLENATWMARSAQMSAYEEVATARCGPNILAASLECAIRSSFNVPSDFRDMKTLVKEIQTRFTNDNRTKWDSILSEYVKTKYSDWSTRSLQSSPDKSNNPTKRPKDFFIHQTELSYEEIHRRIKHLVAFVESELDLPKTRCLKKIGETIKDVVFGSKPTDSDQTLENLLATLVEYMGGCKKGEKGTKVQRGLPISPEERKELTTWLIEGQDRNREGMHRLLCDQINSIWQMPSLDETSKLSRALISKAIASKEYSSMDQDQQLEWYRQQIYTIGKRNNWKDTALLYTEPKTFCDGRWKGDTLYAGYSGSPEIDYVSIFGNNSDGRYADLKEEFFLNDWAVSMCAPGDSFGIRRRKERWKRVCDRITNNWIIPDQYELEDIEVLSSRIVDCLGGKSFLYPDLEEFTDNTMIEAGWELKPNNVVEGAIRGRNALHESLKKHSAKRFKRYTRRRTKAKQPSRSSRRSEPSRGSSLLSSSSRSHSSLPSSVPGESSRSSPSGKNVSFSTSTSQSSASRGSR